MDLGLCRSVYGVRITLILWISHAQILEKKEASIMILPNYTSINNFIKSKETYVINNIRLRIIVYTQLGGSQISTSNEKAFKLPI